MSASRVSLLFYSATTVPAATHAQRVQARFVAHNAGAAEAYRAFIQDPEQLAALKERTSAHRESAVVNVRNVTPTQFRKMSETAMAHLRSHVSLFYCMRCCT